MKTQVDKATQLQAMELWAQLQSAELSEPERRELLRWSEQSAVHRAAWDQARESWALMGQIDVASLGIGTVDSLHAEVPTVRDQKPANESVFAAWSKPWAAMAAGLMICISGLIYLPDFIASEEPPVISLEHAEGEVAVEHYRNDRREKYQLILADGSVSFLNINTAIEVRYSDSQREIELLKGEAYFQVAKDPARPFTVSAGSTSATAIGTAFVVRRSSKQETLVVVTEGRVEVAQAEVPKTVLLGANQSVVSKADQAFQVSSVAAKHLVAWHQGALIFEDAPLSQVLAEIDRYTPYDIQADFSGWREKRLSGTLFIDNLDQEISALVNSFHLQVVSNSNGVLVLAPPPLRKPK